MNPYYLIKAIKNDLYYQKVKNVLFAINTSTEIFTEFESSLIKITTSMPGKLEDFIKLLQNKLDEQMELPPNNRLIEKPL